jgi:RNA polymerase sigma-70 factor (ECF subfamily)
MSIADPLPPTVPDPASPLDDADLARFVRRVVRDLPDRQREVLDLVDLQGYAPTEAASLLGVSPATARVHLMRARRTLRAAIIGRDPERGEHR